MEVKLIVVEGKAEGKEIPLPPTQFIIGRSERCHLRPHSDQVSKVHCAIGRKPGNRVVVHDMKSRNKTYINGVPIVGAVNVNDGDVLAVGPLRFRFAIDTVTAPAPLHEDHVLWLMDESADSFDVESSNDTTVIEIPKELLAENDGDGQEAEHGLSAGQFLKDQVRKASEAPAAVTAEATPQVHVCLVPHQVAFVDALATGMRKAHSTTVPDREAIVSAVLEGVAGLKLDPNAITSLEELKKAITAFRG